MPALRASQAALILSLAACAPRTEPVTIAVPPAAPPSADPPSAVVPPPAPPVASAPAPAAPSAPADHDPPIDIGAGIRIRWQPPEGEWAEARLRPAPDGSSVTLQWLAPGGFGRTRTFEREVLDELVKTWGNGRFDVTSWKSELCITHTVTWIVQTRGGQRIVCKDALHIRRMADLHGAISLVLR